MNKTLVGHTPAGSNGHFKVQKGIPYPWTQRSEMSEMLSELRAARECLEATLNYFVQHSSNGSSGPSGNGIDKTPDLSRVNDLVRTLNLNFCGAKPEIMEQLFRTENGKEVLRHLIAELDARADAIVEFDHFHD